jgi:hypothetical protein
MLNPAINSSQQPLPTDNLQEIKDKRFIRVSISLERLIAMKTRFVL